MNRVNPPHFHAVRWFYLFITLHLILWTLVPILTRYNLPLDAIEGTIWGHQLEWGYDKNPFLNGWLTAFAIYLGGPSGWMIYLFSQCLVVICFWSIWQLARNMLPPLYALIAVMLLECIQYVNFHAIDFNDNTLELGLWALTTYCFYLALRKNTKLTWILTGVFAGLGLMAKYYTGALLASMAIFLFLLPQNRKQLKTLPPYLGLFTCLIIILPHTIWLFFNDFITIRYAIFRASSIPEWSNHFYFPSQFAWQQFLVFLPALLFFAVFFVRKKINRGPKDFAISKFNMLFLWIVGMGPFILTLILSLVLGIKLHAGWGMPLESLWGIILVAALTPSLTQKKIVVFISTIFLLMFAQIFGYSLSLVYSSDATSANFPGKFIAEFITQEWHKNYHTKLDYVAGSRFVSGNIGFYSKDRPAVFIDWDKRYSPWIDLQDLNQKGAVFVWEISNKKTMPAEIRNQFPRLEQFTILELPWHRNNQLPPIKIGMALLPPKKSKA
jgi:hypothetical protein